MDWSQKKKGELARFSFDLIHDTNLFLSTLKDSSHLSDWFAFSSSDPALLPEGLVEKFKGFKGHFSEVFIDIPT